MKILVWEVRTSKGFTLMELSKKSGIGKSTINNIENGKVSPTLFQLEMIAIALGVNITDLFEFKGSAIAEVTVPEQLSGQSLRQLDLRNRFNVTVLLMRKPGGSAETVMTPDTLLEKGDQLTVFGSQKSIIELFKEK